MPSNLKKRFAGLLRQISSNSHCTTVEQSIVDLRGSDGGCFITKYLNGQLPRSEVPIEHGRDPSQLPEVRVGALQPAVVCAFTGPSGGLTAVAHRSEPVSTSEPDVGYIDSDSSSEDGAPPPPDTDGTSLRARLARLPYRNQRLAGNLTLPAWVPVSPPVVHSYSIRLGDLHRYKSQTLPARRCFSDDRLDEESLEAELLQTMMTSLCSTCSDSLPNLTSADGALDSKTAASLELLLTEDLDPDDGSTPTPGTIYSSEDLPRRAEPESSYIGGKRKRPLESCSVRSELTDNGPTDLTSPTRSDDGVTPTNDMSVPITPRSSPSPAKHALSARSVAATGATVELRQHCNQHAPHEETLDVSRDAGLGESMRELNGPKEELFGEDIMLANGDRCSVGTVEAMDSSGVSSFGWLYEKHEETTIQTNGEDTSCQITNLLSYKTKHTLCARDSEDISSFPVIGKNLEEPTLSPGGGCTDAPHGTCKYSTLNSESSPVSTTPTFSPRAVSTPEKQIVAHPSVRAGAPLTLETGASSAMQQECPALDSQSVDISAHISTRTHPFSNTVSEPPKDPSKRRECSSSVAQPAGMGRAESTRSRQSSGRRTAYRQYTNADDCLVRTEAEEIAGTVNWNRPHPRAFGSSVSLYECHPVTGVHAGEPIADTFGVVARGNSALLALADGVNWGDKARLAARCAVHGCLDYLNRALFGPGVVVRSTQEIFAALLRSFHAAHGLILTEGGMLTTLTAAAVVPCHLAAGRTRAKYMVCVCNVGDSLAYVFSERHGVREITKGSHDINSMRDMRDALGALGPVAGQNPELNNLTLSMTQVDPGDIVFLTSDGVSDNFDPVVGKFVLPLKAEDASVAGPQRPGKQGPPAPPSSDPPSRRRPQQSTTGSEQKAQRCKQTAGSRAEVERGEQSRTSARGAPNAQRPAVKTTVVLRPVPRGPVTKQPWAPPALPVVSALQRHELTQLRMDDLLRNGALAGEGRVSDARHLCCQLLDFAFRLTVAKRRVLEEPELYTGPDGLELSRAEQRARRRRVCEKLAVVPGKLDHATVVAYQVGELAATQQCPETAL